MASAQPTLAVELRFFADELPFFGADFFFAGLMMDIRGARNEPCAEYVTSGCRALAGKTSTSQAGYTHTSLGAVNDPPASPVFTTPLGSTSMILHSCAAYG